LTFPWHWKVCNFNNLLQFEGFWHFKISCMGYNYDKNKLHFFSCLVYFYFFFLCGLLFNYEPCFTLYHIYIYMYIFLQCRWQVSASRSLLTYRLEHVLSRSRNSYYR
jgi:hypothetical protein